MSPAAAAAALDDLPRPVQIGLMVLGFIVFWPIGLALLAYLIWSGKMGHCSHRGAGRWSGARGRFEGLRGSGNSAFDEYREETLRRLEAERREFSDYLERLRKAKDRQEFEQFMADRARAAQSPPPPPAGAS